MITNDAVLFGILAVMLGAIFWTAGSGIPFWKKFYRYFPIILACYFFPSLLNTFGLVNAEESQLYFVASRYLLPASLLLLTLSIDLKKIIALGPKAIIMFLAGTIGVIIGGPVALLIFSAIDPAAMGGEGPEAVWRAMTTLAGSWIGGGANQAAMKEVFQVGDELFSVWVTVDVIVANIWLAVLLYLAANNQEIDKKSGADTSAIDDLRETVEAFQKKHSRIPDLKDMMVLLAVAFGAVGLSHLGADYLSSVFGSMEGYETSNFSSQFFWLVVIVTTLGLGLSFTRARNLEGVGASRMGSVFIFILVATIGLKMNVLAIFDNLEMFLVGLIWMAVHVGIMVIVMKLINAPVFFLAVGSKANIGGAASAPVVAAAFHPSLAPVGALLAVLGYALGTYGALFTGYLLQMVAP